MKILVTGTAGFIGSHLALHLLERGDKGRKARMEMLPLQAGDVPDTEADVSDLIGRTRYQPSVCVEEGLANFVAWYQSYYGATS